MNSHRRLFAILVAVLVTSVSSRAGIFDQLGSVVSNSAPASASGSGTASAALNALSSDQLVGGLKQALSNGLQHAVGQLGHSGGFMTNLNVKIPMPAKLQLVEKTLRSLKQDKLADDFVTAMNRAAEQAVPAATSVFADAVGQMSIDDAKTILTGPNDAATQYFKRTTSTNLFARFQPIVQKATASAGVTSAYKKMTAAASGSENSLTKSLGGYLGSDAMDVDTYVTNKALDGLFKMVADEEAKIRANPAARTTDLLQKVFGAAQK
ncbi:MAG TPA: DUF4197 domain-containing protein [Verrucomicrobiae bacterium]|jgi:hypothetical protein|nr:DUF4197 domain-containing protein [Verrucomicrobiae bacterium]